jgi:hypothetical protein
MSKIDAVLGKVPSAREPDAHHGARDALTPLGLAKFRAYFRTQPPLAEGIDVDAEVPGISAGYDLRVGQANELEPMLRTALPLTKPSLEGPDRAALVRAFGGLGKSGPYALGEDDKGPIAPAIAALKAIKAKQAKEAEGGGDGERGEKRKRKEKKEKKEKRRKRDLDAGVAPTTSQGVTMSQPMSTGMSTGTTGSDKTNATGTTGKQA